ncbi:MAG TPA: hypothetical protein VMH90_04740 [Thermoplasmata archaeon]|nr:hypothetical protein [Thermoplasmata archaeon]
MDANSRQRSLARSATLVAAGGVVLYVLGTLLWEASPDGSVPVTPRCHCVAIGGEGLLGATLGIVGGLTVVMATAVVLWSAFRTVPLPPTAEEREPA